MTDPITVSITRTVDPHRALPEQGVIGRHRLHLSDCSAPAGHRLVDAHGGSIWVENRTGAPGPDGEPKVLGARFIVRLPAM